ncbi:MULTISPECIES: type VII toxin-antitoxin system MntA family adenylyltransferase antitoxin [Aquincola]|uniref:type VII toxin-antitoxin system MntA family adenylyltransferase antitoxin n=1 Tax=Aquincola TaxID=391952 RepID=UPI00061530F1|nr:MULTISPECIES: nucleotidyltransferase domain-containing protein [Aquincola]MCR5867024.1 nucleotidyltransferase domain-containing protein [Aquincola sp. J276]
MNADAIVHLLRQRLPNLMAVYAFGSRIQGTADADSDLDLAVLVPGYAEPVALWSLASEVADVAGCHVDLLDMRAASTVMQHQVLTTGVTWWRRDDDVMMWEAAMLNEMLALDEARAPLMADILRRGSVYGQ